MEPLKEMFNSAFYKDFAAVFAKIDRNFDAPRFFKEVTVNLSEMELNQRLRNTSVTLKKFLPADYNKALDRLYKAAPHLKTGYTALVLPDFISLYGKENLDLSLDALKYFTSFGSSEFAVRVFLKQDLKKTLKVMHLWARDKNYHVRRLSSEGSRPRLPWSFRLDEIIRKPELTTGILETLKADEELYVKKSVANHLNDFSKDNPDYMLKLIKTWDIGNPHTRWIIRHASRTLIKKGHEASLALFGFEKNVFLKLSAFKLSSRDVPIGGTLFFEFIVTSTASEKQNLAIDYAIHYMKSSGVASKKVFKLRECILSPKENLTIRKKHAFADLTTRKHYTGTHAIEILINGQRVGYKTFELS